MLKYIFRLILFATGNNHKTQTQYGKTKFKNMKKENHFEPDLNVEPSQM